MARLCPLFSGSSGNSYYIGTKTAGILIDAGRSAKQLTNMLGTCGIDPLAVQGIVVTHEHSDHISGLRVFAAKYDVPVFASKGTISQLVSMNVANGSFRTYEMSDELQIADMEINSFHTSHDAAESLGYRIKTADGKVLTLATDLGYLSDEAEENLRGSDFSILESNHDVAMLQNGPYPYPLKRRILSDKGHLSNAACSDFLPELLKSGTRRVLLAHLSAENNTPDVAYRTSLCSLTMAGYVKDVDFTLEVAHRENFKGENIIF